MFLPVFFYGVGDDLFRGSNTVLQVDVAHNVSLRY